jgi:hypothetical protein
MPTTTSPSRFIVQPSRSTSRRRARTSWRSATLASRPPPPYARIMSALPFIDEHRVHVRAPVERTWDAIAKLTRRLAERPAPRAFVSLWRLEPPSGFAITSSSPEGVTLVGHHRFARYELAFRLFPTDDGVEVCGRTSAEFPGAAGRLYRALVIGSGGHGVAVGAMLRRIRQAAEQAPSSPSVRA